MANPIVLSWINAEVDQALKAVRDAIAKFVAAPGDAAALKPCAESVHQVSGALRMVGLAGATRFAEAIETSFGALKPGEPPQQALGVVDRAVLALRDFVDELARGAANVPLKLFPLYRDLVSLQGKGAIEKELFYPDLSLAVPEHPNPQAVGQDVLPAFLQSQRARFQRGILGWLRGQAMGVEDMRQALDALHQAAASLPEPRAFWWAAGAFIEALGAPDADKEWAAQAKVLCNKIDFQIRDLAARSAKPADDLMREVLYAVALSRSSAARVAEAKQLYQLEALLPDLAKAQALESTRDQIAAILRSVRSRLEALKSAWLKYMAGDAKGAARFRQLLAELNSNLGLISGSPLAALLVALGEVAAKLPDAYPRQKNFMVVEMASAFLLAENAIENFSSPAEDMPEQVKIMGAWLLDAAQGKSSGEPPAGLRASLLQEIGTLQLRAQVAKEILANLQHIEQVLDAFARDPGKRDTLQTVETHLRQINGALMVLGFERAADVLAICETMTAALAAADDAQWAEDMDWIAEGLSSLGFYLEPCLKGREPAAESIDLFFRRYERRNAEFSPESTVILKSPVTEKKAEPAPEPAPAAPAPAPAAAAEEPKLELPALDLDLGTLDLTPAAPAAEEKPAAPSMPARAEVNEELLSIYLDEAGEVLGNIDGAIPACKADPNDRDALTTIRRGFHTLKGSGRMVGLMDLGEVAWEVEELMNRWLEQQRPATPALLELVAAASSAFAGWVAALKAGTLKGDVDAAAIVALARKLKTGDEAAAPAAAQAEAQELSIGGVQVPLPLFEIYVAEAREHLEALERECGAWRAAPAGGASEEFMRAAHTLASSSRTAGFEGIGELAGLLEQWMPVSRQAVSADDAAAVQGAVQRLREMVAAVTVREAPRAAEEAAGRLQELIERLKNPPLPAAPAVPEVIVEKPVEKPVEVAPAPAPTGREARRMHDDIDEQLLPIFLEEAQALLPQIGSDMRDWKANTADEEVSRSLRRGLHTLKGSARMAGAIRLGELCHIIESKIDAAIDANAYPAEMFADIEEKMDRVSLDLERMAGGEQLSQTAPLARTAPVPAPLLETGPSAPAAEKAQAAKPEAAKAPAAPKPKAEAPLQTAAATMRINAETLDHLITESGEVSIARSRVEAELRAVKQSLADLSDSIGRLRGQLREVEVQADSQMQSRKTELEQQRGDFDPLEFDRYTRLQELTRMMTESLHDVSTIQQTLLKNLGETDAALLQQARISRDVQQELMRMRAVPFSNLNERLYRIVRQTAREVEKKAELTIEGSQVELDRSVLERMSAPLEHMLRNSLTHGIESPAERAGAGKDESGRISIVLRQESNEIALIFSDDGAGLDLQKLHKKGVEKGLIQPGTQPTEGELAQLIFASGLSTAESVTQLAGRGVGMDVVRNEIAAIGGRIDISTERGKGTTFTVYLPLTLAVTQAVMVRGGSQQIAIPSAMVEQVLRLKSDELARLYDTRVIKVQDREYPLHYMQHLLGGSGAIDVQTYNSVLLLRSGIQRVAVHVDELIGNQEIVVKNIGQQLARVPGVGGATVMPDGAIVLILNPVPLAQRVRAIQQRMELIGSSTRAVRGLNKAAEAGAPASAEAPPAPIPAPASLPVPDLGATAVTTFEPAVDLALTGPTQPVPTGEAPLMPAILTPETKPASQVVMVVDDSLTVRKITSRLLEREGYQVLTAKDGVDALEQMKETLPGVMLVDIEMPRMDGFDLAKNVRGDSRTASIPIVMISSRTADKHRNQAAQLGVNAFLGKPYQEAELLQYVATFLGN
ncbi:MAG TPA: Hpt domain-containing protein [Burkholderiales bacterium]|nr:Hpt domain-containing protein [Burkholderiales bacterium]